MPAQTATAQKKKQDGLTVVSPPAIASYAFVWKARPSMKAGKDPQFSITLVFPKGTDLTALRNAARLAATKKWGANLPSNLKTPFRIGNRDRADDPLYKDAIFINARTNSKPGVVDQNVQPILNEMDFYSGCKCRASLYAMAYFQEGNKGVSFLLNNVQKLADGTRLSGRKPPEDEFDEVAGGTGIEDDDPF